MRTAAGERLYLNAVNLSCRVELHFRRQGHGASPYRISPSFPELSSAASASARRSEIRSTHRSRNPRPNRGEIAPKPLICIGVQTEAAEQKFFVRCVGPPEAPLTSSICVPVERGAGVRLRGVHGAFSNQERTRLFRIATDFTQIPGHGIRGKSRQHRRRDGGRALSQEDREVRNVRAFRWNIAL